jgi:hypothetical protein
MLEGIKILSCAVQAAMKKLFTGCIKHDENSECMHR